jgi:succinate dehydrogenase / fumarate reductase membrane anchor subunit
MSRRASGLKAWVVQRATAIYLALFGVYLLLKLVFDAPGDYAALVEWVRSPWVALGLLVLIPVALAHAWVGIRDLFMDYVKSIGLRVTLMTVTAFVFVASGLWAMQAIIVAQIA